MVDDFVCAYICLVEDIQIAISTAALHNYHVSCRILCWDNELRYWIKPQSITWSNEFLINIYDDCRQIKKFCIFKVNMVEMYDSLCFVIGKQSTKYRHAISIEVRVCCKIHKLSQIINLYNCSQMFAIVHSSVSIMLSEFVSSLFGGQLVIVSNRPWSNSKTGVGQVQFIEQIVGMYDIKASKLIFWRGLLLLKIESSPIIVQAVVDCKKLLL